MNNDINKLGEKIFRLLVFPVMMLLVGNILIFAQNSQLTSQTNNELETEWYLNFRSKTEPLLYVKEIGKGEKVVVLHGGYGVVR